MAADRRQMHRLIFIDRKIREGMRSGRLANCRTMAAEYEVSRKSIQRDLDYLRYVQDAPIRYDRQRYGYYYSEENYRLPALELKESDLFAVAIAEQAMEQYQGTPLYSKLQRVMEKICQALPDTVTLSPSLLQQRFTFLEAPRATIDQQVWETAGTAVRLCRRLYFRYRKPNQPQDEQRQVDPYQMINHQGQWYLVGHCHNRGQERTFALSRISRIRLGEEHFTLPENFDPAGLNIAGLGNFAGKSEVPAVILFTAEAAPYIAERCWHPEQVIRPKADGALELTLPAANLEEIKRWVLSFGKEARVTAPQKLVDKVQETIQQMAILYGPASPTGTDQGDQDNASRTGAGAPGGRNREPSGDENAADSAP